MLSQALMNLYRRYFELLFWIAGLALLALMPTTSTSHFTLCPFKLVGINFCPGCGLGHSISYLFHGDPVASLHAHPLGIFAVAVIGMRIIKLVKYNFLTQQIKYAHDT
jgi:hypothetical protein